MRFRFFCYFIMLMLLMCVYSNHKTIDELKSLIFSQISVVEKIVVVDENQQKIINILCDNFISKYGICNIVNERIDSVVKITNIDRDWQGTGVFIADDLILTAKHLVEDAECIEIDYGEIFYSNEIYEADEDLALIVLHTNKIEKSIRFDDAKVGEFVFAIGNPLGYFPYVSMGIISGFEICNLTSGEYEFVQTDCPLNPGNSGGPLFDMDGNIVGIVCGGWKGYDGLAFCVPADVCREFVESISGK